jgi:importin subunit alpha-1
MALYLYTGQIGDLCTGNDMQTQCVLDAGVLSVVPDLLMHPKRAIRKETLWLLSNITGGNLQQMKMVVDAPHVLPQLIEALGNDDAELVQEAAWSGGQVDTLSLKSRLQALHTC